MFAPEQIESIQKILGKNTSVVITSHLSPDGDAIGSSLGLKHALQKLGCQVQCIVPNDYPPFLAWMPGVSDILIADNNPSQVKTLFQEASVWFVLDYNADHRGGKVVEEHSALFKGCKIVIDHHEAPSIQADHLLSFPEICSASQLVYEFIEQLNPTLHSIDSSTCLYAGMVTDTGSFRFSSVDQRTHQIAGEMIASGVKTWEIHQKLFDQNTLSRLQLLGYCLSTKMEILCQGKAALISLSEQEMKRFNAGKGDTEGLVNWALSIQGVEVAVFAKESDEIIKLSFRSKGAYTVNNISAENFNGGGHKFAAGGRSELPLNETIEQLKKVLTKELQA